jgi:integral membrane protein
MLHSFRVVSMLEGLSYLAILSVTLGFVSRDFVSLLGMLHGVLFMIYLLLALVVSNKQQWSIITFLSLFIASVVPFAFIAVEYLISRKLASQKLVET